MKTMFYSQIKFLFAKMRALETLLTMGSSPNKVAHCKETVLMGILTYDASVNSAQLFKLTAIRENVFF